MHGVRTASAWLTGGALALALAGCSAASAAPAPSATASVAPVVQRTLAAPTTPEPTPTASGAVAVSVDCATVLPKAVLGDLAKDFTRIQGYEAPADDDAAKIAALGGTVCGWRSDSTGDTLEIAVGRPTTADATALKDDLVQRSHSVPTYGAEGYFQVVEGAGTADAFPGPFWIHAKSDAFYEPGDASGTVSAVEKALQAG